MKKVKSLFKKLLVLSLAAGLVLPHLHAGFGFAQTTNPDSAKVTFTFDDGLTNHVTTAAPVLAKYGIKGVEYVTTSCIGSKNTCDADPDESYMTWTQVKQLQNTYGWEIAAHSKNHVPMTTLSDSAKLKALQDSNAAFAAQGITVKNFATPEGDYNSRLLSYAARYYKSHRGFWDRNMDRMSWPYNDYTLEVKDVQAGVSVAQVKTYIDQAAANKKWLILVFHGIKANPSSDPQEYEYSTANLEEIAKYAKSKRDAGQIQTVTIDQGLAIPYTNVVPNSTFANGLNDGWTTDNAAGVTKDTNMNGSYPSAQDSMKFTGSTRASHLFTPAIPANPTATYALKAYVNNVDLKTGEVGFYIDEYNANGNWESGRWLGAVQATNVAYFTRTYKPSSTNVASFKVQTYMIANATGASFVDNYQVYNITGGQPSVIPTAVPTTAPTSTPAPTTGVSVTPTLAPQPAVNMVSNGSFENVANGFAVDWTRDNGSYTVDSNSKGNDGAKSVRLTANFGSSAHLFSKMISVDSAITYKWTQYLKVLSGFGEFGFYVDEYDANGNWVSGQWMGMVDAAYTGTKQFSYKPTSSQVKSVRLQYYAIADSTFNLYLDSVSFGK